VDEADLYTSDDTITEDNGMADPIELWHKTQGNLYQWSNLLQASGGALKPKKCFWYALNYKCHDGKWSYMDTSDFELKNY
jgi:hypothetical protein